MGAQLCNLYSDDVGTVVQTTKLSLDVSMSVLDTF